MAETGTLRFGPHGKLARELSDQELDDEIRQRRQRRALRQRERTGEAGRPNEAELSKLFANLELSPDAPVDAVHSAYERLVAKYEPFVDHQDRERSQAARTLLSSLERAYRSLLVHFSGQA